MNKNDWKLIISIALIAIILLVFPLMQSPQEDPLIKITIDGKLYGYYELSVNQTIIIDDRNTLEIKDCCAKMVSASCPDQICVNHLPIRKYGESIICLPNKILVTVEDGATNTIDAVVQ